MTTQLTLEGGFIRPKGAVYSCPVSGCYALWIGEGVDTLVGEKVKRRLGNVLIVAHQVKVHGRPRPHW